MVRVADQWVLHFARYATFDSFISVGGIIPGTGLRCPVGPGPAWRERLQPRVERLVGGLRRRSEQRG